MKRKISVGLIKPEWLEEDTVYVTLTPHGGSIRADAISKEEFIYSKRETTESSGTKCDNYISHSLGGTPIYSSHWAFIEMLSRENNAKVNRDRMETDGLELSKLVQKHHYETSIIRTF